MIHYLGKMPQDDKPLLCPAFKTEMLCKTRLQVPQEEIGVFATKKINWKLFCATETIFWFQNVPTALQDFQLLRKTFD